ncbi:MAG: hypothetical protein NTX25_20965, partial [Proteobacteria bacterium]|nr:hypothetical protein [Pseudomonadota bacterium]
ADNCLPPIFLRPAKELTETCYEFDQDMIAGTKDGHTNGTPNGLSTLKDSTEACLASFARAQVKEIENIIDQGLGLQQGMICQAVKDKVDVADAATETGVDLAESLTEAADKTTDTRKPKMTVTEATMNKDSEGVYRVSIAVSLLKDGKTISQTYKLSHIPDDADNSSYHGVMSVTRDDVDAKGPGAAIGKRFISLTYARKTTDSVTRLATELRSSRFAPSLAAKAFNDDGTLNYNAGSIDANGDFTVITDPGKAVSDQLLVAFDLNVDDDSGTFEYWKNPGSNYTEPSRGFVFKLNKNASTGRLEGCGMSGAAAGSDPSDNTGWMSIRKAYKTDTALTATGSYHPFFNTEPDRVSHVATSSCTENTCTGTAQAGPGKSITVSWTIPSFSVAENESIVDQKLWATKQGTNLVSRQCVVQNVSGVYEIDKTLITDKAGYMLFNPTKTTSFKIGRPDKPKDLPPPPKMR